MLPARDNEIVQGLSQVHDMAACAGGTIADADYYTFRVPDQIMSIRSLRIV